MEENLPPENEHSSTNVSQLRKIILSFDTLSFLLSPPDTIRAPNSPQKVPWEIKPRTKSLQQTLRCVILLPENYDVEKRGKVCWLLTKIETPIQEFLENEDIQKVLDSGRGEIVTGKALERRRDAVLKGSRGRVLKEMSKLEFKIEGNLRAAEDVLWPRKIIKLGPDITVKVQQHAVGTNASVNINNVESLIKTMRDIWSYTLDALHSIEKSLTSKIK